MDLRWKSRYCKPPCTFPLIPVFLLQEACPKLSQNEASPIQRALWDQRKNGWVSTSLLLCVLLSAQVLRCHATPPPQYSGILKKNLLFLVEMFIGLFYKSKSLCSVAILEMWNMLCAALALHRLGETYLGESLPLNFVVTQQNMLIALCLQFVQAN